MPLAEKWENGPSTFLGVAMAGFPNLFIVTGPGATFRNMPVSIEHHVEWIGACIAHMHEQEATRVEVDPAAEQEKMDIVTIAADKTVTSLAESRYTGSNVPGKVQAPYFYLGSLGSYLTRLKSLA